MGLLDGKAAVVTGSGRGIGKGHALQLAKAGASVVVIDVDAEVTAEVVAEINALGGNAVTNTDYVCVKSGAANIVAACITYTMALDQVWDTLTPLVIPITVTRCVFMASASRDFAPQHHNTWYCHNKSRTGRCFWAPTSTWVCCRSS